MKRGFLNAVWLRRSRDYLGQQVVRRQRFETLEPRCLLSFTEVPVSSLFAGLTSVNPAWGDYNNDGWVDAIVDDGGVFQNNGGTFTRVGGGGATSGQGSYWGDFNNDGWLDFHWNNHGTNPFIVGINQQGSGQFLSGNGVDGLSITSSLGTTLGDFNSDGFLDIYIGGFENWPSGDYPDRLIISRPDSSQPGGRGFQMVAETSFLRARGVTAADFNEDGHIDIYASNYRLQPNLLLVNNGSGTDNPFSDRAAAYNAQAGNGHSIGSAFGDLDSDGHLDILAGNFSHAGQPQSRVLLNQGPAGNYHFSDLGQRGIAWKESWSSPALGDYDNDGMLDLFFTALKYYGNDSELFRNTGNPGNPQFAEVTSGEGIPGGLDLFDVSWADWDNDGDLDLATNGRLFRNQLNNGNSWLKVNLRAPNVPGVNGMAIGAIVRVTSGNLTVTRHVEAGTGQGNMNDPALHFGLGKQTGTVNVEITWPGGSVNTISSLVNQIVFVGMTPPGTPSEPSNLVWQSINNDSAEIAWNASTDPDGDQVTYDVQYRKDDLSDSWSVTSSTTETRIQLNGLAPATSYRVRIRASDGELDSEWVEVLNLFTTTDAPPPPGPLSTMSVGNVLALVVWEPSPGANFETFVYELQYRKSDLSDDWTVMPPTGALGQQLTNLEPGTSYRVRVRGFDGQLYSDWRDQNQLFTTTQSPTAPSVPSELSTFSIGETVALVVWEESLDVNGDLVFYELQYRTSDLSDEWRVMPPTSALGQQLTNLEPGTSYRVRVRAFDGGLYSDWQDIHQLFITFLSTPAPPTVPGELSTNLVTDSFARVTWGESLDPNGDDIIYYAEFRKADLSDEWTVAFATTSNQQVLLGLEQATRYHVRVRAYDGELASDWQQTDNLFTTALPAGSPTTPGALSTFSVFETSALVVWEKSTDPDEDVLSYEVQYRRTHSTESWTLTNPTNALGTNLFGLLPGTRYDVRVRAFDGQLYSLWQEAENLFTTTGDLSIPGDINQDGEVNSVDIDSLFTAVGSSATDNRLDLNDDDVVDRLDVDYLVHTILGTHYGDQNLDGRVDTRDITTAFIHFTGAGGTGMTWADGDTDGNGDVSTKDLVTAIINFTGA